MQGEKEKFCRHIKFNMSLVPGRHVHDTMAELVIFSSSMVFEGGKRGLWLENK